MQKNLENWYNLYSDELYAWAFHKTSNKEVSEDLVQETFLSAVKGFKNFKNDSKPKTWLFAILNNKIIDYYRKKAKLFKLNSDATDQVFINLTDSLFDSNQNWKNGRLDLFWEEDVHLLDNEEFIKVMENCVNDLPENWRLAIQSKYLLNVKAAQICQELHVTKSNYWQIIHRAKLWLSECIGKNWKE
jgi:RNA polymerase sigma-70 factor (ECF subfamily)